MKLPNYTRAIVPQTKVADYLLSFTHRDGHSKAMFFTRFGYTGDDWEMLAQALLQHAADHEVTTVEDSPFGTRYAVDGELQAPDGRRPYIRVVWFIATGEHIPYLVTAYPQRRKGYTNDPRT